MKKTLALFALALALLSCKKDAPEKITSPRFYPIEITRTFSNTPDIEKIKYTYNTENQLIREEIFRNETLTQFFLYSYNVAGKLATKRIYGSTGRFLEQDEMVYDAANIPQKLKHAYIDTAGVAQLHHYRTYQFSDEGRISRWTDLAPDNSILSSRNYQYQTGNLVESVGTGSKQEFIDKITVSYDGQPDPFENTGIQVIRFSGNELNLEIKNQAGQVIYNYVNTYMYNTQNYPQQRIRTSSDGMVSTETYIYKSN